jgi:hypothetical protein
MCKRKNEDSQMKREEYERQMLYCDQDSNINANMNTNMNTNLNTNTVYNWNNININNGLPYEHASQAPLFGRQFVRANKRSMIGNGNGNFHHTNSNYSVQGGH